MNPYLDDDLIALADQARRFATDRTPPALRSATGRASSTAG